MFWGWLPFKIISFLVNAIGYKEGPLELVNAAKGHGVYFGNFITLLHLHEE